MVLAGSFRSPPFDAVCRDCFRPVELENRWHHHLVAIARKLGASEKSLDEEGRSKEPQAWSEGRPDGQWILSKGLFGISDTVGIDKLAPTDPGWAVEHLLQPGRAGNCCERRAREEGSGLGPWPILPSIRLRASAGGFLRWSVSNGGDSVDHSCYGVA